MTEHDWTTWKVGMRIVEKQGGAAEKTILTVDHGVRVIATTDKGRKTRIDWQQLNRYEKVIDA